MKILKVTGIILAVVIVIALILVMVLPTTYNVERSVTIDAPKNIVFGQVAKFENFIKWSPWSALDPNMTYEITGTDGEVGAVYSWSGNDSVGTGSLTTISLTEDRIEQKLDFTAPWEAHDLAYYEFEDTPEGIKVTWGLDGNMPRPMNLMGLFMSMDDMIGADYEKGLTSLKDQVTSFISSHTKRGYFINENDMKPKYYVIKRGSVKFTDIQNFYTTNFQAIMEKIQLLELPLAGAPSGLYYTWDMENSVADMAAGIPITEEAGIDGFDVIEVAGKSLEIKYYGSYSGSAEAHYAMDDYMKENGLELNELVIEEYITDPTNEPDTSKWLTNIYYMVQ
jgi:effector-binding domain-containing protein